MLLLVLTTISCLLSCHSSGIEQLAGTRIDIKKDRNYGTLSKQSDVNEAAPETNPFGCIDTATIIMSFLSNQSNGDCYSFGLTNRAMFRLFNEIRNHSETKQNEICRMKGVSDLYEALAKDLACWDRRMLKKRLNGIPYYFCDDDTKTMDHLFSKRIFKKMKNEHQFRIVRAFDAEANKNYFGAIVLKSYSNGEFNAQFVVFECNQRRCVQICCSENDPLRPARHNEQMYDFKSDDFLSDLLLDDEHTTRQLIMCCCKPKM